MKTLSNSCHKLICGDSRNKPFSSVTLRNDSRFPLQNHTEQLLNLEVLHLVSTQHKEILPVSKAQDNWETAEVEDSWETAEVEDQAISETKTVHVKFQLQKECLYGEQFLLLGDDPLLGRWDPENALPLTWSDGHVWTVDLDLPVGKAIQFKFILIDEGGEISWQPGSDRIFKTWETEKTIAVCEDWDNAELQKIVETERFANQDKQELEFEDQKLIVAENLTSQKEELPYDASDQSSIGSKHVSELKQIVEPPVELLVADSSYPMDQLNTDITTFVGESMSMIADNIGLSVKGNRVEHSEKHTAHLNDKSIDTKMSLENNGNATTENNTESLALGNLVYNEEVPVLVPGLPPLEEADEATPDELDKRTIIDNPVRPLGYKDHNLPQFENVLVSDDGAPQEAIEMLADQEPVKLNNQEEFLENKAKKTDPKDATHKKLQSTMPQMNVLQNDIQWGHRTLQKFLTNLGLIRP